MLLSFQDREVAGDTYDISLTDEGLNLNVITSCGEEEYLAIRDEDRVRLATALLTLQRHEELTIESFPLGERVRLGSNVVDVPDNEESANAILERASALLATVGLYQEEKKRKIAAAELVAAKIKRQAEIAKLDDAIFEATALRLDAEELSFLHESGIRYTANV